MSNLSKKLVAGLALIVAVLAALFTIMYFGNFISVDKQVEVNRKEQIITIHPDSDEEFNLEEYLERRLGTFEKFLSMSKGERLHDLIINLRQRETNFLLIYSPYIGFDREYVVIVDYADFIPIYDEQLNIIDNIHRDSLRKIDDLDNYPVLKKYNIFIDMSFNTPVSDDNLRSADKLFASLKESEIRDITITFDVGTNGTSTDKLIFKVEKGLTFGEHKITLPNVTPNAGYQFVCWEPAVNQSEILNSNTTYIAKHEQLTFTYTINYALINTTTTLRAPLLGEHVLGTLIITHPVIPGYVLIPGQQNTMEIHPVVGNETNEITIYYAKDTSQWVTITFNPGPNALTSVPVEFEVIKNHPLNDENQPTVTPPTITPNSGYKVSTQPWDPAFFADDHI